MISLPKALFCYNGALRHYRVLVWMQWMWPGTGTHSKYDVVRSEFDSH